MSKNKIKIKDKTKNKKRSTKFNQLLLKRLTILAPQLFATGL